MEQRDTGDESGEEECEKLSNWASRTSQPTPVPHRALECAVSGLLHILQVAFVSALLFKVVCSGAPGCSPAPPQGHTLVPASTGG